jgi:hyaluronan synthase
MGSALAELTLDRGRTGSTGSGALDGWASVGLVALLLFLLVFAKPLGLSAEIVTLLPLGLFGLIRWLFWLARRIPAIYYKPIDGTFTTTTTVITPVYNEDPEIFEAAVRSWLRNHPTRIIAVIDVSDTACKAVAERYPVDVIMTDIPGKRPALAQGIAAASTELVVLTDSDTIWADDVLDRVMQPFAEPKIAGVGTRQMVLRRDSIWQRLADMYLSMRYDDEVPAQTVMGRAVSCLSGRTAAYRRAVLQPLLGEFLNERFMGQLCISGEDKRLTSLVLREGHDTYFQNDAIVWSTFPADLRTALNQRTRWSRNSYRSDMRGMWEGWLWRRVYLAVMLVDRLISPFALLVSLGFFIGALISSEWIIALLIGLWWVLSRAIRVGPHLRRRPEDVAILPAFIGFTFLMAFVKIYAMCTMHFHKWSTRPVEVVDDKVVYSGTVTAKRKAPFRNRIAGISIATGLFVATQGALLALGGAGYLPRTDTAAPLMTTTVPAAAVAGQTILSVEAEDAFSDDPLTYLWVVNGTAIGTSAEVVLPASVPAGTQRWAVYVRDVAGNTGTLAGDIRVTAP